LSIHSQVIRRWFLFAGLALSLFQVSAFGQSAPCPRYQAGSTIIEPKNLFSAGGKLEVDFTYQTRLDQFGNTLYCFTTSEGVESPTLHVHPGDRLIIRLKNELPSSGMPAAMPGMAVTGWHSGDCSSKPMDNSSVNIHYHGTNAPPVCHQDEVITTLVNSGDSYEYDVHFPSDEPPGLYWYHPHIHGISEAAVLGGASWWTGSRT
jgi:FtsP/CotA-like multicopper oxidase with cupredoxin domain